MQDVIKVSLAKITLLVLATFCFIGFYLAIEWAARALARASWI